MNGSNLAAKRLAEGLAEFAASVDCCARPNLDKRAVRAADLVAMVDALNVRVYERAFFLRCFRDEEDVADKFVEMFGVDGAGGGLAVPGMCLLKGFVFFCVCVGVGGSTSFKGNREK